MNHQTHQRDPSSNREAFAAWASLYDTQANPLLALEERYLARVLPLVHNKDILDAGCGTGRWLQRFEQYGLPSTLHGIDSSPEMLRVARLQCAQKVSLILAQLPVIPLPSKSIDLALCSFTLSYVANIDWLAEQLQRVLREGGDLLISDMHPDTAAALKWNRGFRSSDANFQLEFNHRTLDEIAAVFNRHGFEAVGLYQPCFGEPEQSIFAAQNRQSAYMEAMDRPAIYILHIRLTPPVASPSRILLSDGRLVLGNKEFTSGTITVDDGVIKSIGLHPPSPNKSENLDLTGFTVFPGLINAHDHLEFGLFPRLGNPPYSNATEWARDIHLRFQPLIETHTRVPLETRLWFGGLRNLLCGVTSVCHHNPNYPIFLEPDFPVRVLTKFSWAHSLAFSDDIASIYEQRNISRPFILHAGEGIDHTARTEVRQLIELDVLGEKTTLVHGLALTIEDIHELNRCGGSLITCPSSNQYLFLQAPSKDQLAAVDRLAIGSDSPLTAEGDLLDEIQCCTRSLGLSSDIVFNLVTDSPANMFCGREVRCRITPSEGADLFVVRSSRLSPARQLTSLTWRDIELVMVAGSIRLASDTIFARLTDYQRSPLSPILIDGTLRWIAGLTTEFFQSAAAVLGSDGVFLNGRRISLPEASDVE